MNKLKIDSLTKELMELKIKKVLSPSEKLRVQTLQQEIFGDK